MTKGLCIHSLLVCTVAIVHRRDISLHGGTGGTGGTVLGRDAEDVGASEEVLTTMDAIATSWLSEGGGPSVSVAITSMSNSMDITAAAQKVERKQLPEDVASLVKIVTAKDRTDVLQPFSEASLDKARVVLNGLVEASWKEMDDKIINAKNLRSRIVATTRRLCQIFLGWSSNFQICSPLRQSQWLVFLRQTKKSLTLKQLWPKKPKSSSKFWQQIQLR